MVQQTGRKNGLECSNALYKYLKKLIRDETLLTLNRMSKGREGLANRFR